ncbi:hypothetical protein BHU72_07310 [Desulfuribacillus stibiiarsenatis]|uniref:DUF5714 domain-containing protein n=1 Tax=Desulfuribacillus stibiiarsenatis TaxID=1390249 RepID=A0A1E5L4D0_9FIRM|nr:DUF5714 domain-containing protein [Desulfuribacillus stibiiarsenatis]OEH84990.1 hypothetical protein BHU72_07310 [Desulfuribacillus stibiiarsenatis]
MNALEKGYAQTIREYCLQSKEKNPVILANEIMGIEGFPVAGQAHHPLIAASLLTAYANALNEKVDEHKLDAVIKRSDSLPAGFCAGFGSDAAIISLGITVSVILGNTVDEGSSVGRTISHTLTGMGMLAIANNSGARCCKRSTFTALTLAANYLPATLGVTFPKLEEATFRCQFFEMNKMCNKKYCKYYP